MALYGRIHSELFVPVVGVENYKKQHPADVGEPCLISACEGSSCHVCYIVS